MIKCAKKSYNDKMQAVSAIRLIRSKGKKRQFTPTRAYLCDDCGKWHITHQRLDSWLDYKGEDVNLKFKDEWDKLQKNN